MNIAVENNTLIQAPEKAFEIISGLIDELEYPQLEEQRLSRRFPTNQLVEVDFLDETFARIDAGQGISRDISLGGLSFFYANEVPDARFAAVRFLHGSDPGCSLVIELRHSFPIADMVAYGGCFYLDWDAEGE